MPFEMQRRVSRRWLLKLGAAAGATVTGWAAGLVPEIVSAQAGNASLTDDGRELSADEVRAHLSTLHAPGAERFTARLASMGHTLLHAAASGATNTIEGQVFVLLTLSFSKVGTTGASIYVLKKNSMIESVSAVRFAPTGDGGTRVEELVTGTDGAVRSGRSATMGGPHISPRRAGWNREDCHAGGSPGGRQERDDGRRDRRAAGRSHQGAS